MGQRVARWDVTETVWHAPGAAPVVTTGLVAERRTIGSMLQEILRPTADAAGSDTKRIDYLHYNRVAGRWEYVSMDMRAPVGIMSATSFGGSDASGITLQFQPIALPGRGTQPGGQMMRMDTVVASQGADRDTMDHHFIVADGTGTRWLAHRMPMSAGPDQRRDLP